MLHSSIVPPLCRFTTTRRPDGKAQVEGMCVGGRRRLRMGPHLAYRDRGLPAVVPPNAKLTFDVELLAIE